jgi:hypothetical protein
MPNVVVFAGPIELKPPFKSIDWEGKETVIVPVPGSGSANFANLGDSLVDGQGRILPRLLAKFAPKVGSIDKLALCAYSAGHGLLNKIGQVVEDVRAVNAVVLNDACFVGDGRPAPVGLTNWAAKGAAGTGLFVATSSRGDGATYQDGTTSVGLVWAAAQSLVGTTPRSLPPRPPVDVGTWQRLGKLAFWGDIPTLTHGQHHDYAPVVWQAYLAPYLAETPLDELLAYLFPLKKSKVG